MQLVIIINLTKPLYIIGLKNWDYITPVKYINSTNKTILFILLITRVSILYNWCKYNNWDKYIIISITKTSYIKNDIMLE